MSVDRGIFRSSGRWIVVTGIVLEFDAATSAARLAAAMVTLTSCILVAGPGGVL